MENGIETMYETLKSYTRCCVRRKTFFIPFYLTLEYELLRLVWKLMVRVIVYQIVLILRPKERK